MKTALYRHYDAEGSLLYVGVTDDLRRRDKEHIASDWHNEVVRTHTEWHCTRVSAVRAERLAILNENPKHNVQSMSGLGGLADRVRDLRAEQGMTLRQFATAIEASDTQVSNWETGIRVPSIYAAIRIKERFGLSLDKLFTGLDRDTAA